jgi:paraquat-inducible protein B
MPPEPTMTADRDAEATGGTADVPVATVERKRRFSLVWLIPIVAAVAGIWLVWVTFAERGPTITITLQTASGIEPGKTPIKFRDVQLGVVETVSLSDDLQRVVVSARMQKAAEKELRTGTQFWVESARITAAGVSGLGTLLSGAYIGMRPGEGAPARSFVALEVPPVYQVDMPGKQFTLRAERLGSIAAGAPIYFRGIQVGSVLGYKLDENGRDVSIIAFVAAPYDAFVREESRFWNASGIDVTASVDGVNIRTESLQAILAGGLAFDTPVAASMSTAAADNAVFPLFASYEAVQQARYTIRVPFGLIFHGSAAGLEVGAPVVSAGIQVGEVTDIRLEVDPATMSIRIPVTIALEPQRWTAVGGTVPSAEDAAARMAKWVEGGLRARLESGSLITGQKIVTLGVVPDAPPASIVYDKGLPILPTVPSEIEILTEKATAFLDKLEQAPVAELVSDLRNTVQHADRLLASASVRQGVDGVGPLLDSLKQASDAARLTLEQTGTTMRAADQVLGVDSALRYDLARMVKELTTAARSLRTLADFLENNPDALLLGKPAPEHP